MCDDIRNVCTVCGKQFSCSSSLLRHVRKVHKVSTETLPSSGSRGVTCAHDGCVESTALYWGAQSYRKHLHDAHAVPEILHCTQLNFNCQEDFLSWKLEQEKETAASFVMQRGTQTSMQHSRTVYDCNRTGSYVSQGSGVRQLKSQGSCKTGRHCTAEMIVLEREGVLRVTYYQTHFGHDKQLGHIPLTLSDRERIADQLEQGVPARRILSNIRSTLVDEVDRVHLTTRQDVLNVKLCFDVKNNVSAEQVATNMSDAASVEAWVQDCSKRGVNNPVLYYKHQDEVKDGFQEKDFLLAIMTPFQRLMLEKFGSDRVCLDSTHGMTGHDFLLSTLMVVDEYDEGFPVGFLYSSSTDAFTLRHFFHCIKSSVGVVSPQVFMTDDAPAFYNAWADVMGEVPTRLLCSWHVDRAWKGKLNTITDRVKSDCVYAALKECQTAMDEAKFLKSMNNLLSELHSDLDTEKFGEYFEKTYSHRVECWAWCYRKHSRINTNMRLENFHKAIKICYLDGKTVKRVDKSIEALFDFMRDKQFARLTKLYKGKLSRKVADIAQQHKKGIELVPECRLLDEHSCTIPSKSRPDETYTMTRISDHICTQSCVMKCRTCSVCYSSMTCTCVEYLIHGRLCQHTHAAHLVLYRNVDTSKHSAECIFDGVASEIKFHEADLAQNRACFKSANIHRILAEIGSLVNQQESDDILLSVSAHLRAAKQLLTMRKKIPVSYPKPLRNVSANKLISPQKRFFSVVKRKGKRNVKRATGKEAEIMRNILCGEELLINTGSFDHDYTAPTPPVSSAAAACNLTPEVQEIVSNEIYV